MKEITRLEADHIIQSFGVLSTELKQDKDILHVSIKLINNDIIIVTYQSTTQEKRYTLYQY